MTTVDMLREMLADNLTTITLDNFGHYFVGVKCKWHNPTDEHERVSGDGDTMDEAIADAYESWLVDKEENSK